MEVTKDIVIKHLTQLRATLAHGLKQRDISPKRFNEIREQLLPLDEELRKLGIDVEPVPEAAASYVKLTRHQRRIRRRAAKFDSYETRLKKRKQRQDAEDDAELAQ